MYKYNGEERPCYYMSDVIDMLNDGIITQEELDEMNPEIINDTELF